MISFLKQFLRKSSKPSKHFSTLENLWQFFIYLVIQKFHYVMSFFISFKNRGGFRF